MNINKIFIWLIIGSWVIAILVLGLVLTFGTQQTIFPEQLECSYLRECVLLEIPCLEKIVNNKLFFYEWNLENKALLLEQRDYYRDNCMEKE